MTQARVNTLFSIGFYLCIAMVTLVTACTTVIPADAQGTWQIPISVHEQQVLKSFAVSGSIPSCAASPQVLFNASGICSGSALFTWDTSLNRLNVGTNEGNVEPTYPNLMRVVKRGLASGNIVGATFEISSTHASTDSGALRGVYDKISGNAAGVRAVEAQVIWRAGTLPGASASGVDVGVGTLVADTDIYRINGVFVQNWDGFICSPTPCGGLRAGTGVLVAGTNGWNNGFAYIGETGLLVWQVDKDGLQRLISAGVNGAVIRLEGGGVGVGTKSIRAQSSNFEVLDHAFATGSGNILFRIADNGNTSIFSTASSSAQLTVNALSGEANGANLKLVDTGDATPNKYLRSASGNFDIMNSAYGAQIFTVTDTGVVRVIGSGRTIQFWDSTTAKHIDLISPTTVANNTILVLPDGGGSGSGQCMKTDAASPAIMSWAACVTGTADRITITGTGASVVDIASTYVGQATITTLGTITTGVWNAGAVSSSGVFSSGGNAGLTTTVLVRCEAATDKVRTLTYTGGLLTNSGSCA